VRPHGYRYTIVALLLLWCDTADALLLHYSHTVIGKAEESGPTHRGVHQFMLTVCLCVCV
jgi:hypothetical protein